MNIKEDCFGVSINLLFGRTDNSKANNIADAEIWTKTTFYIDNVVIHDAK